MRMTKRFMVAGMIAAGSLIGGGAAEGATIIIDDFEANEGHFGRPPSHSGTTVGETETAPSLGPSTADRDTTQAFEGLASQRIFIDDDPAIDGPGTTPAIAWRVRHLSGDGTPANNTSLTASGFVGYYLKTTTAGIRAGIMIDDGAALELSTRTPIIADGEWHLYEWNFDDATQWDAFAGTGPNGAIDAATVTIDALYFDAPKTSGDQDAVFFIDAVSHNAEGAIPEPTTFALLGLGGLGLLARRRRVG